MRGNAPFLRLPEDIFFIIFTFLPIRDILLLRLTNKSLSALTYDRSIWFNIIHARILRQHIPLPPIIVASGPTSALPHLSSLPSSTLEYLARRALSRHHTWTASSPVASRTEAFHFVLPRSLHTGTRPFIRVVELKFLPGYAGRYLFSVSAIRRFRTDPEAIFAFQCWDVHGPPLCVAERRIERVTSWAVNAVPFPGISAAVAIQYPDTEFLAINPSPDRPVYGFHTLSVFPEHTRRIRALSGRTIACEGDGEDVTVWIWDIERPDRVLGLQNPDRNLQLVKPQAVYITANSAYAIVIRQSTLELYPLRSLYCTTRPTSVNPSVVHPLATHTWRWPIDSIALAPYEAGNAHRTDALPSTDDHPPINMLIRFGSAFPWPVNLLHHWILQPNPLGEPHPSPDTPVPYAFPPVQGPTPTLAAPVRLFEESPMCIGRWGTAIWVDSHTEGAGPGDSGQRATGRVLSARPVAEEEVADGLEDVDAEDGAAAVGGMYASSVYATRPRHEIVRVAVDEEAGRVALGYVNGAIELMEYE
ncbi:hypothetical protein PLICRDRAFT_305478 [Plicaturopsis crispa FD-325 SS-3]|nr:hypothetical protein PLICRDRAFT_305478 [Plicaturopsis crispa FD-325 SS-3]